MQNKLFQTLLIAAMLATALGSANAEQTYSKQKIVSSSSVEPCCCAATVDACVVLCKIANRTLKSCYINAGPTYYPTCQCSGTNVYRTIYVTSGGCKNNGKNFCP